MTGDRIAVIDLGSNTFHLLVCEITGRGMWKEICKERAYVKLASGGLNIIDEASQQRAVDAMVRFMQIISAHAVTRTRAIGTAALREAKNGPGLAEKLEGITGIPIEIIDGADEAAYILKGIRAAMPEILHPGLVMDIGGGSVEFILYKGDEIYFAQSFKIGMAVLFRKFHRSDPLSPEELQEAESFLEEELRPMTEFVSPYDTFSLVGASGAFEVLRDILPKINDGVKWAELDMGPMQAHLDAIIRTSYEERRKMGTIPGERLDYIVMAYVLIRFVTRRTRPEGLYFCDFALKEGVVVEMIEFLD